MNAAWALVSLPVALIATPIAAAVARRTGVVDRPGPLKIQQAPVPYLGGVAVFVAMAGPIAVVRPMLLVPLACLLALGLADDLGDLAPRLRLVCEVAIGAVGGAIVPVPGPFGAVVTAAFVVGLVNAVNLLDGLDGLAGGVVCASAIGFALIGGAARVPGIALAGALGGFLWYNRPPARIYLGDSGAYLCGGALALLAALALGDGHGLAAWAAVPLLVALPVFDTTVAILRRSRAGKPLFAGDRSHVYDQLVDRGSSRPRAVAVFVLAQLALMVIAVVVLRLDPVWAVAAAMGCVIVLVGTAAWGGFLARTEPSS